MAEDSQLLRRFANEHSESAFGELVARHLPLVYSTALRQTFGDTHLAQDVAQLVFADLARKAPSLSENVILAGWLHRATIFAARQTLRGEHRRRLREQHAVTMNAIQSESESADWQQIRPLLDEALERLNKTDRDALLLRFFEQQSLAQIGTNLGSTEDAARKRIARALEKLRAMLQRRGVTTTAVSLSTAISANAVQVAPAGLAATLTKTSFIAAGTGTTLTLLKIMTATQLKLGVSALVLAGATTAFIVQHQAQARLREENQSLQQQIAQLQSNDEDYSNRLTEMNDDKKLSDDQFNELLQLRGEVGMLRHQTDEIGTLQAQLQRSLQEGEARQATEEGSASNQQRQIFMAKMNNSRHLMMDFIAYASANHGQFPTNFDQVDAYTNQYSISGTDGLQIVYQGSQDEMTNPSEIIVVQESQASSTYDGKWAKVYGFADGHSEVHVEADGDFSTFEQQHTFQPPANNQ
jgi:RNA polymerase sigma factor (sigma-70 family)